MSRLIPATGARPAVHHGFAATLAAVPLLIIEGPPGGGKDTQTKLLAAQLGAFVIATGDLLRPIAANPAARGHADIKATMASGELAPDKFVFPLVSRKFEEFCQLSQAPGALLFNGFPRTLAHAQFLDQLLTAHGVKLDLFIHLDVPPAECWQRLPGRGRGDDQTLQIAQRLSDYERHTPALLAYYRAGQGREPILRTCSGLGTIAEVHRRIQHWLQCDLALSA